MILIGNGYRLYESDSFRRSTKLLKVSRNLVSLKVLGILPNSLSMEDELRRSAAGQKRKLVGLRFLPEL